MGSSVVVLFVDVGQIGGGAGMGQGKEMMSLVLNMLNLKVLGTST